MGGDGMRQKTWLLRAVCMVLALLICVPTVLYVSHTHSPAPLSASPNAASLLFGSDAHRQGAAESRLICRLAYQLQAWLMLLLPALLSVRLRRFLARLALRFHLLATRAGYPTLVALKIRMNR